MAQIDFKQMQLIVENAMRESGCKGDFEDGWKSIILDGAGGTVENKYNFQNMRDATAQAIVDALSEVNFTGLPSTGNIQGVQVKIGSDDTAAINYSPLYIPIPLTVLPLTTPVLGDKSAARIGDTVQLNNFTDPTFVGLWTAIVSALYAADNATSLFGGTIATAVNQAYGGPPTVASVFINGMISSGSDTVKIGDSSTELGI